MVEMKHKKIEMGDPYKISLMPLSDAEGGKPKKNLKKSAQRPVATETDT